ISWEMLGPLLDRGGSLDEQEQESEAEPTEPTAPAEVSEKLSLDGGLSEAFAQAQSAAEAQRQVVESGRVPKAAPPAIPQPASVPPPVQAAPPSVLEQVQAARAAAEASVLAQVQAARAAAEAAAQRGGAESAALSALHARSTAPAAASALPQVQAARATIAELAALSGTSSVLAQVQAARSSLAEHLAPTSASKSAEPGRARPLIGRRVLVVDDDPAMLWFFSGVVRDAGGEALQARDGAEGLEIARRKRPQLVLSDILMPKLDGFALRRALARDLYLERTPVLLLSWKGDPVEDNEGNASGLLRKEASVPEVLAAIERALLPRQQLEQALRADEDVTGQVDDLGIISLIECIVAARPDVRLTVEDAADLFEVAIAEANQISVTRTAADGTFTRGERALLQLVGVTHGRVHVSKRSTGLRSPLQTPLKPALHAAVSELTALIDGVSSERVAQVARVTFDEDSLASRLPDTPAIQPIVAALRAHRLSPSQLLAEGRFSSGELAACFMPLARQAVVTGLWSAEDKDLLADITRLHMPRPSLPPAVPEPEAPSLPSPSPSAPPQAAAPEAAVVEPAPAVQAEAATAAPEPVPEVATAAPEPVPEVATTAAVEVALEIPAAAPREEATVVEAAPETARPVAAKPIEPESDFESDPEA
ncbi:MAG TPA: response regulator, partial [Polyangiales bacterium]|nr:response regulator [Polyangiales bacterium]